MTTAVSRAAAITLVFLVSAATCPQTAEAHRRKPGGQRPARRQWRQSAAGVRFTEQELDSAPSARDLWSLLEHRTPTVVSQRLDVGGSATGTQGLVSARATTWQENVYRLDGVDMTDPAARGTSSFFYDYDALQEVAVSWGSQPASVQTGGVLLDMTLRRGGDEWHGAVQGYLELEALQADNLPGRLAVQGVPVASAIDYLSDTSFEAGGPLSPGRVDLFAAYRDLRISQAVPGFVEAVDTALPIFTLKVGARPSSAQTLSVFLSRQRDENPARGADPLVSPEATLVENGTLAVLGGTWAYELGGGFARRVRARGSYLDVDLPLDLQSRATRQSQLDIVTRVRSGSASLALHSQRRRYAGGVEIDFAAGPEERAHDGVFGLQYGHASTSTAYSAVDDVNIVTSGGAPFLAQLLDTPVDDRSSARSLGLFVHDELAFGERWSASLGLRYDDWSGGLPAQSSPPGTHAPGRQFAAAAGVIGWRGLAPRATLSYDASGDGRLVMVVGFAQYLHQLGTSTLSFGNPNSLGATVVSWVDDNGDGQFQPGEGGTPMSVAGGAVGRIDADLSAPLTRELRAGAALELGGGWRAHTDLWYRKDLHLFDAVEVGLQAADFAEDTVVDPGADNVLNSGDDRGLIVHNQIENFGGNALLLQTVDEKTVTYKGMDIAVQRSRAGNWALSAVLTLGLAEGLHGKSGLVPGDAGGISDLFSDPNALTNAAGRMFWDRTYVLKVYGSYVLPHRVAVAGVLRSWAGAPRGRILPVALNQGIVEVWADRPGFAREDALTTADVRLSKELTVGRRLRLGLFADLFNITNAGTVVRTNDTFPLYAVPAEIVPPFVARLGARLAF